MDFAGDSSATRISEVRNGFRAGTRGASLGRVPAPPRVLAADSFGGGGDRGAHELAKQRAAEFQRCWAELIAPDGRAYWHLGPRSF